ncbi:Golgi-associated PDZ and coiled-coil motif-containing protein isoform X4 [Spodoptera frugiperda]|uniref:Golgi-associated PDZ and coiled-coil motif-containing protein isoform X4 n=1 Tax=Spodoptera frugiperda TaxID=7108 RepID=A0A9R0F0M6_SPOFR|nr:Golgi-associated PDZ and coiled-coil motif-containing protein isoform X4 [Spodoptera frugiperda]
MATTGVGFRWLDLLEKEFDKACVELDTSLTELETEEPEVVFVSRQKIATLSSCFAQLTHKALTIFQNSAKIEAELVDMRAELVQARAASAASECSGGCQESGDAAGNVTDAARARSEAAQLARENAALRETVLALHSELFGARLATKYLDKELAGRIQQLQLLGRDMRAELRDSLWAQVEAEILVQRHKTLVRVCRGAGAGRACGRPGAAPGWPGGAASQPARPLARTVRVRRSPHLGLGISVTGGREHGVPILISELEAGGPAALTGELYVGDAILAINDVDLTQACHKEAVQALQSVKGDCALCVQFIATDDDDRLSEDNYRFPLYPEDGEVFGGEQDGSGATPTAPRTPDYNRRTSDAGSGSESESEPYRVAPPPANYPDYNNINNNLNILDMDDDSIKIEARLEWGGAVGAGGAAGARAGRGGRAVLSSADSAASTPVHARPNALKKKRKPQTECRIETFLVLDWRTKGAYRPVELEAPSSDEPLTEAPCDNLPVSDGVPESPIAPAPPQIVQPLIDIEPKDTKPSKPNGDVKPLRRESKGFRIGSARRVTEGAPLTNGEVERAKFPPRLLAGDGDPDFGTPV